MLILTNQRLVIIIKIVILFMILKRLLKWYLQSFILFILIVMVFK